MEIVETAPDVDVQPDEYVRLLGYPRGHALEGRALELAEWARAWYRANARPWAYARIADRIDVGADRVEIDGTPFTGPKLRTSLSRAGADGAVLVAVSAGDEAEEEARRLWEAERPDEYFFLEVFASAVVEHLTTATGAKLCAWAEGHGLAVLPHYSPGYPGWDIAEQAPLLRVTARAGMPLPGPLRVLPSGALWPKKSLLAVFGVTRQVEAVRRLTELVPCENCSFGNCQYRRAPYRRTVPNVLGEVRVGTIEGAGRDYTVNRRALRRWARERLSLEIRDDGAVEALFRYDGTTCTNMGRPLTFHYAVTLGPREQGYPIRAQRCTPAPGDAGHRAMCGYLREGERLVETIASERPLVGQALDAALGWPRPSSPAGCYCEAESRAHKWGLVLETIHYALSEREREGRPAAPAAEIQGHT